MGGVETIRPAAVAGRFYDPDVNLLRKQVEGFCADVDESPSLVRALIAPHAGLIFSGRPAGMAYGTLAAQPAPSQALVVGPSHCVAFSGLARSSYRAFATPMGEHPVRDFGQGEPRDDVHAPEHSIETHLPFLTYCCGPVPIIPWVTGQMHAEELADAMEGVLRDEPDTLVAVSSDLSHFHAVKEARRRDAWTTAAIESGRWEDLGPDNACGHLAISGLLILARRRNWQIHRRMLCSSGDVTGSKAQVVGYGSWIFTEEMMHEV